MLTCRIHAKEDLRIEPAAEPDVAPGQVLMRLGAGGICGSDLHYYFEGRNGSFVVREPLIPGHEASGVGGEDRRRRHARESRRQDRGQPVARLRALRLLPRGTRAPLPQHALSRQREPVSARAGHVLRILRDGRAPVLSGRRRRVARRARVRRAARGRAARGQPRRRPARQVGADHRRRHDRLPHRDRRAARRRDARSPCPTCSTGRSPPRARWAPIADDARRPRSRRAGVAAVRRRLSKCRAASPRSRRASPRRSAAASSCRSARCRTSRCRSSSTRSWARSSTSRARSAGASNSTGRSSTLSSRRVDVRPLLSGQFPLQDAVKAFELAKDKTQSTKVQVDRGLIDIRSQQEEQPCVGLPDSLCSSSRVLCIVVGRGASRSRPSSSGRTSTRRPSHIHKWSVWAAGEIEKRTNGRITSTCFPASSLGKESDINQGLTLGTVDMIISGLSFAARTMPRIGVGYYPYTFRDGDHLIAWAKSPAFAEMIDEYRNKTGIQITAMTYYGIRQSTSNKRLHRLRGHEGTEDARAGRAGVPRAAEELRRQSDADRVRRGLPRAAERHGRRAGESADDDRGEEVLRGAEEHHPDRAHRRLAGHAGRAARVEQALRRRTRRSSST